MRNTFRLWKATLLLVVIALLSGSRKQSAGIPGLDEAQQIGQEVFNELKGKGVIVKSSPLYDLLNPITEAVVRTAQPRYNHPFKFYLVHEQQPNAFATPGGNVYVTDSLMYFVKNTEQREVGAAVLFGPSAAHILAIALIGKLHSLGYSREAESSADLTGADICAASGYNPWGLVWLFKDFDAADLGQVPQILSDHPNNPNRVSALERHFRANPKVFSKYSSDPKTAKHMVVPANTAEIFLR